MFRRRCITARLHYSAVALDCGDVAFHFGDPTPERLCGFLDCHQSPIVRNHWFVVHRCSSAIAARQSSRTSLAASIRCASFAMPNATADHCRERYGVHTGLQHAV